MAKAEELFVRIPLRILEAQENGELECCEVGLIVWVLSTIQRRRLLGLSDEFITQLAVVKKGANWPTKEEQLRRIVLSLDERLWISAKPKKGSKHWVFGAGVAQVQTSNLHLGGASEVEVSSTQTSTETSTGAQNGKAAIPDVGRDAPASKPPPEPPPEPPPGSDDPSRSRSKPSGKANLGGSRDPRARGQARVAAQAREGDPVDEEDLALDGDGQGDYDWDAYMDRQQPPTYRDDR
jgi:hypothetical protein